MDNEVSQHGSSTMDADAEMAVSPGSSTPLFVEIFAGKGAFSRAALQAGLRVVSIGHEVAQPLALRVALEFDIKEWLYLFMGYIGIPQAGGSTHGFALRHQQQRARATKFL